MKRTIWTIIITGMLVQANAQWYNYMGNRVIFNMEASFSPAWKSPNPVSTGWDIPEGLQRYLGLNYFLYPSVELMVWEKGTVGAGYDYYNSPFDGGTVNYPFELPFSAYETPGRCPYMRSQRF